MSAGLTPQEFVQQVYYMQEKVILDFYPSDDKYREVIMEANLVLQELQKEEDWNWLRREFKLGLIASEPGMITKFNLTKLDKNNEIYKPCSLYGDAVRIYTAGSDGKRKNDICIAEIPFGSPGTHTQHSVREFNSISMTNVPDLMPRAYYYDDAICFNRPLYFGKDAVAYIDIVRRFTPLHLCNDTCVADEYEDPDTGEITTEVSYDPDNYHPCNQIEDVVFTEIPDSNYMVVRTAYKHAMGSPSAQGRIADLADDSQKLLSAMRQNSAMATDPDYLVWDSIGYIEVI